jgi:hypothetical protein
MVTGMEGTLLSAAIEIRWQTTREVNSAGFAIFRANPLVSETYAPLSSVIGGKGTSGGSYLFVDKTVEPGVNYSYLLVESKLDGTTIEYPELAIILGLQGPDAVSKNYLPLVLR